MGKVWSVKKAAVIGLIIGIIGLLADLTKRDAPAIPMQLFLDTIQVLTPVAALAAVAWLHNRIFVRKA